MRLFPNQTPSERQIKWAVDTKVQQGVFPVDSDVLRMRKRVGEATFNRKVVNLTDVLLWYQSLCDSLDQDGVKLDCCVNTEVWPKMIRTNNSSPAQSELFSEQADLLMLSHLRSRVAYTQSGLYEALTFQRRAKIVLGVGSVAGRRDGPIDRSVLRKCNI